ncbi:MAG: hypothetical protein ACTHMC_18455 [Pseudobacter sp.]|uniref:hypothetical protein n=1 Tax=Pseudobacter sp. TaxID=2045420 RepID=UPI003F7DB3A5
MIEQQKEFISFLFAILKRNGMFNVNNVEDINLVILGYEAALISSPIAQKSIHQLLLGFRVFVNAKFETHQDFDWARVIRFNSGGDKPSLELFESLFTQFTNEYTVPYQG